MTTFILVLFAIIVTMCGIIYALVRDSKDKKKEIQSLKNELSSAKEKVKQLTDFIRNSSRIRIDEKKIADKIKEAKTDEEVYDVISDIIALNNNRVQND